MTFDPTKPVQTRDGRKARIVSDKVSRGGYKYIAIISEESGDEWSGTFISDGSYYASGDACHRDLINVPEKREMWVNVYDGSYKSPVGHDSRESADLCSFQNRIACVRVEYEVGEGL